MDIIKEEIIGTKIINEIESSNILKTIYDINSKTLIAEFKNGVKYEYYEIPHQLYTSFRTAKSQGTFFNINISKTFKYKKLS